VKEDLTQIEADDFILHFDEMPLKRKTIKDYFEIS